MNRGETQQQRSTLETAGAVVGLLAGVVTLVYVLGGAVIALRLRFDDYSFDSVRVALGQLPRELVITTAMLTVIGPAVMVGLAAALVYGAFNRPLPRRSSHRDDLTDGKAWWVFGWTGLIAFVFAVPVLLEAVREESFPFFFAWVFVCAVSFGVVAAGWYLIRRLGRKRGPRLLRALAAGGIWAIWALIPAAMAASVVSFEEAQVCTSASQVPQRGSLIGEGGNQVLLGQHLADEAGVLSLPADQVTKTEYGDLMTKFTCPAPPGTEAASPAASAAKLGDHGSEVEQQLAMDLRPRLRFDSGERWRPIAVDAFLAEGGRHGVCRQGQAPPCPPLKQAAVLRVGKDAPAYIDIHGEAKNGDDFASPESGCLRSPPALDCNSGPSAVIYYRRTTLEGRWYWDYWWFFRYSDYTGKVNECKRICGDHEGDWEGITLVTTSSLKPEILGAIYASHGHRVFVDATMLPTASGHPLIWIARGTHASYPYDCDGDCKQYGRILPEDPHDGAVPWGGNRDSECEAIECVRPLPGFSKSSDALPVAGSWAGWGGRWGSTCYDGCPGSLSHREPSPRSPGTQSRFQCPWVPTLRAKPADKGRGLLDSERVGDRERLFNLCQAQRGGGA